MIIGTGEGGSNSDWVVGPFEMSIFETAHAARYDGEMRATDKISSAVEECVSAATEAQSPIDGARGFIDSLVKSGQWTGDEVREVWSRAMRAMGRSEDYVVPRNLMAPMEASANELVKLIRRGDKITAWKKTCVVGALRFIDGGWWVEAQRRNVWMLIPIHQVTCVNGRMVRVTDLPPI